MAYKSTSSPTGSALSLKPKNPIVEENVNTVRWLSRIKKKKGYPTLNSLNMPVDFGPMMQSKKLYRTNNDIRTAADLWCFDRAEALKRYGHISDWDVSSVTDMSELFRGKKPFEPMEDRYRG